MVQFREQFHLAGDLLVHVLVGAFENDLFHGVEASVELVMDLNRFVGVVNGDSTVCSVYLENVSETSATEYSDHFKIGL